MQSCHLLYLGGRKSDIQDLIAWTILQGQTEQISKTMSQNKSKKIELGMQLSRGTF